MLSDAASFKEAFIKTRKELAARAGELWLPIEHAPRDGSDVDVLVDSVCHMKNWNGYVRWDADAHGWRLDHANIIPENRILGFYNWPLHRELLSRALGGVSDA